jgi:hypothetical protein
MKKLNMVIPANYIEKYKKYSSNYEDKILNANLVIETIKWDLDRIMIYYSEYLKNKEEIDILEFKKIIEQIKILLNNINNSKKININDNEINIEIEELIDNKILTKYLITYRSDMKRFYYTVNRSIVEVNNIDDKYLNIYPIYNSKYINFDYFYVTNNKKLIHNYKNNKVSIEEYNYLIDELNNLELLNGYKKILNKRI